MKVFLMTDMEGVSGVIGRSDRIGNRIENFEESCRLLTEEVNATVEGLVRGGARDVVVTDGHGGSHSIRIESLHPSARLLRCSGELFPYTWSLDRSYDAAVQIGAHAMMGTTDGFLHHSFNSHAITQMLLNNSPIGEIGIIALLCAYFDIPTLLVSGDVAACREAREFIGEGLQTVETKTALNRYSSIDKSPLRVREELSGAAQRVLERRESLPPRMMPGPYVLQTRFMCPNLADVYEKRGAERVDFLTVSQKSEDFLDLWAQRMGWYPSQVSSSNRQ